ncbi:hypothetical protein FB451DRAFT_1193331 [Mycena latifolia]|nr:hypothetical protein FB451DRAFT_1193331 [Mycena latifolia]
MTGESVNAPRALIPLPMKRPKSRSELPYCTKTCLPGYNVHLSDASTEKNAREMRNTLGWSLTTGSPLNFRNSPRGGSASHPVTTSEHSRCALYLPSPAELGKNDIKLVCHYVDSNHSFAPKGNGWERVLYSLKNICVALISLRRAPPNASSLVLRISESPVSVDLRWKPRASPLKLIYLVARKNRIKSTHVFGWTQTTTSLSYAGIVRNAQIEAATPPPWALIGDSTRVPRGYIDGNEGSTLPARGIRYVKTTTTIPKEDRGTRSAVKKMQIIQGGRAGEDAVRITLALMSCGGQEEGTRRHVRGRAPSGLTSGRTQAAAAEKGRSQRTNDRGGSAERTPEPKVGAQAGLPPRKIDNQEGSEKQKRGHSEEFGEAETEFQKTAALRLSAARRSSRGASWYLMPTPELEPDAEVELEADADAELEERTKGRRQRHWRWRGLSRRRPRRRGRRRLCLPACGEEGENLMADSEEARAVNKRRHSEGAGKYAQMSACIHTAMSTHVLGVAAAQSARRPTRRRCPSSAGSPRPMNPAVDYLRPKWTPKLPGTASLSSCLCWSTQHHTFHGPPAPAVPLQIQEWSEFKLCFKPKSWRRTERGCRLRKGWGSVGTTAAGNAEHRVNFDASKKGKITS